MKKGVAGLCEAIVLQSMEEILSQQNVQENVDFLMGEGMNVCASIIGLKAVERKRILDISMCHAPVLGFKIASVPMHAAA